MFKPTLITALGATLALTACTDPGAYPDDNQRTRSGAIIGALIGGASALTSDDDNTLANVAVRAGIGAAVGGVIGQQLDRQARDLRNSMGDERIKVTNTGDNLVVTMPQDILFATNSATLRPDLQRDLRALAANLRAYPNTRVDVIGHTDNTGAAGYNQMLSAQRAGAVTSLLANEGVASSRLRAIGRGEDAPIASNLSPEGRALNRRVEIIITPTS